VNVKYKLIKKYFWSPVGGEVRRPDASAGEQAASRLQPIRYPGEKWQKNGPDFVGAEG